jgi:phage/plasmid-associated DNA primase
LKLLVGGEPLEVRQIYGHPHTMENYVAKLVFLTNHLPRFRNGTDAELRRIQILSWEQVPAKPDPNLLDLVSNEKDGIYTKWMVPPLQQILTGLKPPPDEPTIRGELAVRNDPMQVFLAECCILDSNGAIEKKHFRGAFAYFVDKWDLPKKLTEVSASGRLLIDRTCGKVRVTRPRQAGKREHIYAGIMLKPDFEREYADHAGSQNIAPNH